MLIVAFNWFLSENHLHQVIYNASTGGCYDGLEENNVNLNQGAESTISYLLARLAIQRVVVQHSSRPADPVLQYAANDHSFYTH